MNQPIQENKEECNYCKLPHDTSMVCKPYVDSVVNPPQNTSREEIRERWRKYVASEVEVSPTKLLIWWLAEIEAAEKRGQEAERERVQEELEGLRQERDELIDELYKIHH